MKWQKYPQAIPIVVVFHLSFVKNKQRVRSVVKNGLKARYRAMTEIINMAFMAGVAVAAFLVPVAVMTIVVIWIIDEFC